MWTRVLPRMPERNMNTHFWLEVDPVRSRQRYIHERDGRTYYRETTEITPKEVNRRMRNYNLLWSHR